MEITEEEEEEERERKRQSTVKEEDHRPCTPKGTPLPPVTLNADLANSPEASRFSNGIDPPQFTGLERPYSPTQSLDEAARRASSQSSRPDLYPISSYPYKPRVKLGPRPSAAVEAAGRPGTSGSATTRPVATLPDKIKALSKGTKKGRSAEDEEGTEETDNTFLEAAISAVPESSTQTAVNEADQPAVSNGMSALSSPSLFKPAEVPTIAAPLAKQNTMTPEKARLLKAMKLREKKKMMSLQPSALELPTDDIPSALSSPGLPEDGQDIETRSIAHHDEELQAENHDQDDLVSISKAESNTDSGIGIEVSADQSSIDAQPDSHPTSPFASSDIGASTQASSLSDSTEETIVAKDDEGLDHDDRDAEQQPTNSIPEPATKVADEEAPQEDSSANLSPVASSPAQALPVSRFSVASVPVKAEETRSTTPTPLIAENEEKGTAEEASPIHIPLSKFSTKESKSPTNAEAETVPAAVAQSSDVKDEASATATLPAANEAAETRTVELAETASAEAGISRRKGGIEHIQTSLEAPELDKRQSVISITDNDGFMEELRSATLQQATPITVSKSPISPFFPNDSTSKRSTIAGAEGAGLSTGKFTRTVSSPVRTSLLTPKDMPPPSTSRSASSGSAYLQRVSQQQAADSKPQSAARVGSSISQRIQALQKLSGSVVTADAVPKARPASTFFAVRKAAGREPSRSPSVADRTSSLTNGPSPSPPGSIESSPDAVRLPGRDRSGSVVSRLSMFEGGMPPRGRPDSIQVTARIVRDPNQPYPHFPEPNADAAEYGRLELKQSPLMVDLQNRVSQSPARSVSSMQDSGLERRPSLLQRRISSNTRRSESRDRNGELTVEELKKVQEGLRPRRRSSLTVVKDFIKGAKSPSTDNLATSPAQTGLASPAASTASSRPPSVHNNSFSRRLSIGSRRSSMEQNSPAGAVLSPIYTDVVAATESDAESRGEKTPISPNSKTSRTSRFMRRISNTLAPSSRKTGTPSISPTVAEENAAEVEAASRSGSTAQSSPTIIAFMGDVNVQFPDNLLWKRRSICLDSHGFLILSAVSGTAMMPPKNKQAGMMKRYHISDFKTPYTPDVELQELPNSVVLDFVDGSGLQIACEDRAGQMNILHSKFLAS